MARAKLFGTIAAAFAFGLCAQTQAAPLAPGAPDQAVVAEADGSGSAVAGPLLSPFASAPGPAPFSGILTSSVIQETIGDNPLGGLTFLYQISNDSSSLSALQRFTHLNFSGVTVDVSVQSPVGVGDIVPATVNRDIGASGSTIGWNFSGANVIPAGSESALLVVQTDAPAFEILDANIIDGGSASAPAYGPVIPEPATLGLLGLSALALLRRR